MAGTTVSETTLCMEVLAQSVFLLLCLWTLSRRHTERLFRWRPLDRQRGLPWAALQGVTLPGSSVPPHRAAKSVPLPLSLWHEKNTVKYRLEGTPSTAGKRAPRAINSLISLFCCFFSWVLYSCSMRFFSDLFSWQGTDSRDGKVNTEQPSMDKPISLRCGLLEDVASQHSCDKSRQLNGHCQTWARSTWAASPHWSLSSPQRVAWISPRGPHTAACFSFKATTERFICLKKGEARILTPYCCNWSVDCSLM